MGPRPVSPQRTSVWAAHVEMGQCVKNRELPLTRQNYCQENTYTYSHALLCMHLRIVSVRATVFSNRVSVVLRFCCRFCGSVNNQPLMFNRQPFCEGLEKWSRFNEWLRNRKWVSDVGCGGRCSGWARGPHILYPRALLHHVIFLWKTFLLLC